MILHTVFKRKVVFHFILILVLGLSGASAQVSLPNIFGDHMVLQQNHHNPIWGKASVGENITVSIAGQIHQTKADKNGNWQVKLLPLQVGEPLTLSVKGKNVISIKDVLVGEVWLCTGQSNMAMPLRGGLGQHIEGSQEAIINSKNNNIRLFNVETVVSKLPLDNCKGNWGISNPKNTSNFSAIGYFFGAMLEKQLHVPIGLISCNEGATPAQAWTPQDIIESEFPEFKEEFKKAYNKRTATGLYNGMIHPIIPFGIKGAIWYQGEGNRWNPEQYSRLFPAMIKSWRHNWKQGNFPFYFVQLASYGPGGPGWVGVQQAQLKTMLTQTNTGMIVTNDIGYKTRIHPPKKKEVGLRLALWALAKDYNIEDILYSGPVYDSMKLEGGKAIISFKYAPLGITSMGKTLTNFEIAGEDGVYQSAKAKIASKGKYLQVWSDKVKRPKAVRYGWNSYFEGSLFNTAGLPASSFSTEEWDVILKKQ